MSKLYRFPHLRRFDGLEHYMYIDKISDETAESADAFYSSFPTMSDDAIIEIMDVMQACETALRNSGRTEEELLALMEWHNAKDRARGYDKPREEE